MYEGVYGVYVFLRFHSQGRRREINWISELRAIQIARISLAPSHLRVTVLSRLKGGLSNSRRFTIQFKTT